MNTYAAGLAIIVVGVSAWHAAEFKLTRTVSEICLDEHRGVFSASGNVFLCRQYQPQKLSAEKRRVAELEGSP